MVFVSSTLAAAPDGPSPALVLLNKADAARVEEALQYVRVHAAGHVLDTDEPAVAHMLGVADLLAELRADANTRMAGALAPLLLLDKHFEGRMEAQFGADVAEMLVSLRKLYKIRGVLLPSQGRNSLETLRWAEQMETLRKMLLAMASDIRVVMIRLCSRLQTLRHFTSLEAIKAEQGPLWPVAQSHAQETLDLFAPLANRLGLWQIKWELEDLAFRILQPNTYKNVARMLDEKRTEREAFIEHAMQTIAEHLRAASILCDITGRPKHIYSIWNKMRAKGISFDKLYDVRACRVIVKTVEDCYTVLGIVHSLWQPIAEEFDDYISKPKPNGYQSLHTVVQDLSGKTLEVQIRTEAMHQFAEYGVAAHWRYKEAGPLGYQGESRAQGAFEDRIALLRQLLAWQKDVSDALGEAGAWAKEMNTQAMNDRVYVFTPQARVVELPAGSTPLDFAYHVHTELGHRCRGAKVNGQMVPLNTPLEHGQTVEVVSARGDAPAGPSRDWLNANARYLVSMRAKQKVKQWFAQAERNETLERGKSMAERELQRIGQTAQNQEDLARKLGYEKPEDLYLALAREELRPRAIEHALRPPEPETGAASAEEALVERLRKVRPLRPLHGKRSDAGVLVVGVSTLLTNLARCCRPAPPDPIVGFVTRGKGVSIHRVGCSNLAEAARRHPERLLETSWGEEAAGLHYPVDIAVTANDRQGLLRDITEVFSREKINVIGVNTESQQGVAKMQFTAEVRSAPQLQKALGLILEVQGVFDVRRK